MKHKLDVYEKMMAGRVVAILRKIDVSKAVQIARAIHEGGINALEVTMDTPGALEAIQAIRKDLGDNVAVGAGTVLDCETGRYALLAGAQFLVAPNLNPDLIRLGNRYGRLVTPGCLTPTEIEQAYEAGADIVKVFPAGEVGPEYIKSVKAPLDHIVVMATGGISAENAAQFRAKGADILGVGGNLVNKDAIAKGQFHLLTEYSQKLVEQAK